MVTLLRRHILAASLCMLFILAGTPAWAVQVHRGTEGLVSHQIGHALFMIGMGYLLVRLYIMQVRGKGWIEFKIFLWLLLVWNVTTFSGHWMDAFVAQEKFTKLGSTTIAFSADNLHDFVYYFTRLDHLILVPAFVFLLVALKKKGKEQ